MPKHHTMFARTTPIKLADSQRHGAGTELFIVEGDSAARSVTALRDASFQAVLPMQGKPLNAIKASQKKIDAYPLFQAIESSLGAGSGDTLDIARCRFERIVLLFDPDADGIHCGALMLMYFHRRLRPLLDTGAVHMIYAPWLQFAVDAEPELRFAYSEPQGRDMADSLRRQGVGFQSLRPRGLAGIDSATLQRTCIAPETRKTRAMSASDAETAMAVFGSHAV